MKKIKTIEAVAAYKTLKALKTTSLNEETMMSIWKNMKALRGISETYDKDIEEAQTSLKDDKLEEMQKKLEKCRDLENKAKDGYLYTKEDNDLFVEVNTYFAEYRKKTEDYFKQLSDAEVEVEITEIEDTELLKAIKASELSFSDMEMLGVISK